MLNIKDLLAHEKKLAEIIRHAQQELDAIRLLISGMRLRSEDEALPRLGTPNKKTSLKTFITQYVKDRRDRWVTGKEITDAVIDQGLRKKSKRSGVRATIANYLKALYDDGTLTRKNIGTVESPKYEYQKREGQQLPLK